MASPKTSFLASLSCFIWSSMESAGAAIVKASVAAPELYEGCMQWSCMCKIMSGASTLNCREDFGAKVVSLAKLSFDREGCQYRC